MKYATLELTPAWRFDKKRKWILKHSTSDIDRLPCKKYLPEPGLGFFYYPQKWPIEKAFKILKESMIKRRQEEIEMWKREIEILEKVELSDYIKKK